MGDLVLQSKPDLLNGADLNLNSYVSHTFQVREMPGKISGVCSGEDHVCRVGRFTVNSHENQGECVVLFCLFIYFDVCLYDLLKKLCLLRLLLYTHFITDLNFLHPRQLHYTS